MSASTFTSGKLKFELSLGSAANAVPRDPDAPLHILIMGDFSGESRMAQAARKPVHVDIDNFDQVIAAMKPRCRILLRPTPADLSFASLDDFHPDRVLPKIAPAAQPAPNPISGEENRDLLARLMGGAPSPIQPAPTTTPSKVDIGALIKNAVGSDIVLPNPADQAVRAESEISQTNALRCVLHDGAFQTLESNWRGVDLLVRAFGGEEQICLSVVDYDFAGFLSDISAGDDLSATPLFQLLRKREPDARFAVVLALYSFEPSLPHMDALLRAAKICAAQGATFVSAAGAAFAGSKSFASGPECGPLPAEKRELWEKLRALPEANRLALALPRFLLRQPYGATGDPIESFTFEELTPDLPHEHYLWGNPAILCAHALAENFVAEGWDGTITGFAEVGDLPVHRFKDGGETRVKPCAETWMPDHVAEELSDRGFVPVQSIKGRDAVRLAGLRPVSSAGEALSLK